MFARVPRNAAAILVSRLVAAAAALVVAVVVADRLGSAAFGTFAAVLAAAAVANTVLTFGLDTVVVRSVADETADGFATFASAVRLRVIGVVATVVVCAIAASAGLASSALFVASLSLLPQAVTSLAGAVLRGRQEMTPLLWSSVANAATTLILALVVIDDSVTAAVAVVVVGQLPGAAYLALRCAGALTPPDGSRQHRAVPQLLGETWVFAVSTIASAIIAMGSIAVFALLSDADAGGLAAGSRLLEAARMVPGAVFGALFPAMFTGVRRSTRYRTAFAALIAYSLLATSGLIALAPWLSRELFGNPSSGTAVIRIMALAIPVTVFRLRWSFELIADGRERAVMFAAVAACAAALVGYTIGSLTDSPVTVAWVQVAAGLANAALLGTATHRPVPRRDAFTGQ